jgi:SAM-dependent methyltransferase
MPSGRHAAGQTESGQIADSGDTRLSNFRHRRTVPGLGRVGSRSREDRAGFFDVLSKKETNVNRGLRLGILALSLAVLGTQAAAQPVFDFLKGLTVPYVPTNQATVEAMRRITNVGPEDFVIDLGSGDGRILITAARLYGARGFGVDLDPQRVKESVENARLAGVADRVSFQQRDLFDTRIAPATVVTMYLLPEVNRALRPRLLTELKPGTRVVAHDFDLGKWKPDIRARVRGYGTEVHFYVVPAQVAGKGAV